MRALPAGHFVDDDIREPHAAGCSEGHEREARACNSFIGDALAELGLKDLFGAEWGHFAADVSEVPGGEAECHYSAFDVLDAFELGAFALVHFDLQLGDHLALLGCCVHR